MEKDNQSRKWLLTFNNPSEHGITHNSIKIQMEKFKSVVYWCMANEIGDEKQTPHIHLFMVATGGIRFSTVKNRFPTAHIDYCNGTSADNRAYVFKEGLKFNRQGERYKYTDSRKCVHTGSHYDDTNQEYGEMPIERPGARNDITDLYDMIKSGLSNFEILEQCPQYMFHIDRIERVRQTILSEKYSDVWRDVDVTYIWGVTGTGKTRSVMDKHGYKNVFRITDYDHPFDTYKGQDVVVFDEFRSSLKLGEMLDYLDGYPVEMKARYSDKQACFHKVYIISNIDIRKQYRDKQEDEPLSWDAFLRRIDRVIYHTEDTTVEMPLRDYMNRDYHFLGRTPFDKEKENKEDV